MDIDARRPVPAIDSVLIEELTWMEVRDAIKAGKTTVIVGTGSATWNRGQAASSASSSHFGFRPRHLGTSAGGTANVNNSSIDQR